MEEEEGGLCRSVPAVPNFCRRPKPTIPLHSKCIKDQLCFWHHAFSTNRSPTISSSIQSTTRRGELYFSKSKPPSSGVPGRHLHEAWWSPRLRGRQACRDGIHLPGELQVRYTRYRSRKTSICHLRWLTYNFHFSQTDSRKASEPNHESQVSANWWEKWENVKKKT